MTDLSTVPAEALFQSQSGKTLIRVAKQTVTGETISRQFDAVDGRGRRFGARVTFSSQTRTVAANSCWLSDWLGTKVVARPQALRNGRAFGGTQADHFFDTDAEARAWAERYFADAERRALKNKARAA
jgi:hypothetical protein